MFSSAFGAFAVVWGVFEANLEVTLWSMTGEAVAGICPTTDRTSVSDWITAFRNAASRFPENPRDVVVCAADAAENLMHYRHALLHGSIMPFPSSAVFVRNPRWHGEMRKRESNDAHVDANLLDLAIGAAWDLCTVVFAVRRACDDASQIDALATLKTAASRARSFAGELRHLTALMNHEKY